MKIIPGNNGEVYLLSPAGIKYIRHPSAPAEKVYDVSGLGVIPRIIHQTWATRNLHPDMQTAVNAIKAANPGWSHRLYDDETARKFIIQHFGSHVTWAYDTLIPGTYKADLFRYCVMYVYGGVYLDIKYVPVDGFSFESWLPNETYVLEFGPFVYQGCFMCPPKHPRLKAAIDHVVANVRNGFYGDCHVCTTGPHMFGRLFTHDERVGMLYGYRNNGVEVYDRKSGVVLLRQYDGYRTYQSDTYAKAGTKYWSTMWGERTIFDMDNFKSKHCPPLMPPLYAHDMTDIIVDKLRTILNKQPVTPVAHTYTDTDIIKGALTDVDTSIVPRLFWCSWNTITLPPIMSAHMSDLMQAHPQFKLNVYSDNDCRRLISDYFTDIVVSAFDSIIPGAYKSDLWRYCALYVFGGIYFDVKFFPVTNFNYEEFITENNIWVRDVPCFGYEGIFNGFIVSKPRNPLLLEAIMKSCRNIHAKDYRYSDLAITGPHLFREAIPNSEHIAMHIGPRLTDNTNILYLGNRAILKGYLEYRGEQVKSGTPHYNILYKERRVFAS